MDRPSESLRFPRAALATPHYLASQTGASVLARGGNAVDAIVAANLVLGVVTPYYCGFGGDLFAMIWDGREHRLHALQSAGRAPAAATIDAVRERSGLDVMPVAGPHSVTVPGAVAGWFALLDRFGTRSFGDLAADAIRLAAEGFDVTARGGSRFGAARQAYRSFPDWARLYGEAYAGEVFRQPPLARTLATLAAQGPDAYYRGPIATAIVEAAQREGGLLATLDLATHRPAWVEPLRATYRDVEVLEMPPPTQGVTALQVLRLLDGFTLAQEGPERLHLLIEACKLALADRDAHVADPAAMAVAPAELLAESYITNRRSQINLDHASHPQPGTPQRGGTAYLCAADSDGLLVSLIQSNFLGFGSGIAVDPWGFMLHNRGASFSFDEGAVNRLEGGKFPMHTLIPALAFRGEHPWLVFGTMGGDGQAQTHAQLLARVVADGADPQWAIDMPRFKVDPATWIVRAEPRFGVPALDVLRARGHDVVVSGPWDDSMGHAHVIARTGTGYAVATDPRAEGAAAGI